jgi:hypothetical protein
MMGSMWLRLFWRLDEFVYGGMAGCIYIMMEVLLDAVRLLLERFMRDWIGCAYKWSALHGKDIWVPMASGVYDSLPSS